ncbi:MAG: beta-galactosidase [Candidatus Sericytochromatia bacterium]
MGQSNKREVALSTERLQINGRDGILFGGEFQYFRIPATLWERSLERLAQAEINFISCYIPWIWHMPTADSFDFTGETAPERDLRRLIGLVKQNNLALVVRPGPYVYGEYQGFGIPEWLRSAHPEILMVYEQNVASREVALNHPVFKQHTEAWLAAVLDFLRPDFESGHIVACQIDNETGLPQFGGVATVSDFNPHTVQLWQNWLQARYSQISLLNHVWDTRYASFEDVRPPQRPESGLMNFRHWAEFIEDYLVDYLEWLSGIFESHLPGFYLYLNDPYLMQWPNQSPKKARLATIGYDIYSKFTTERNATHDVPFALSFAPEFYASLNPDRLLMGVEVGTGWFDPRVKVNKNATLQKSMLALLRGTRILDYYLLHDCVETDGVPWIFQSPLDRNGEPIDRYEVVQSVGRFAKDHGELLAQSEPLYNAVGVLKYLPQGWEYLRSNYTLWTALDLMDSALTHFSGLTSLYGGLIEAGFNPVVHDLESIPLELMCQLKVIFFACTPVMHREMYQKLLYYVEQGGTLVSFGFPVSHDFNEVPYQPNPLYPARPAGQPHRQQFGNNATLSQIALDIMDYQMMRRNHPHRLSLHTLDMMHPFVEFTKYMGKAGTWLETERGQRFWASRFVSGWRGGGITPLLSHPNQGTVGYTRRLGRGRSVFLGTLPGLFFDTPAYYSMESDKKRSVLDWLRHLLRERGLWPLVEPIPDTEVILRQAPDGAMLLGLVNRGPDKDIEVQFNHPVGSRELQLLFNPHPDTDFLEKGRFQHLRGHLSKDSVLVARLD